MAPKDKTKGGGELNDRQRLFVREYLVDLNATQAAIRAGYSAKTAAKIGSENLQKPDIQAAISAQARAREAKTEINAATVLEELLRIARADIGEAFDEDGHLKAIHDIPEDVRRAIAGIEVVEEFEGRGADRQRIGFTKKLKFWDKKGALELLGKHLVLFTDKTEHSGGLTLEVAVTVADASS